MQPATMPTDKSFSLNAPQFHHPRVPQGAGLPHQGALLGDAFGSSVTNTTWMESRILLLLNSLLQQISHILIFTMIWLF